MVEKKYPNKSAMVEQLRADLDRATAVVVTEYRGLKAGDLVKLRKGLGESNVELRVVKNTLLRRAAEGTPLAEMMNSLSGPTAVAIGYGEATDAAKTLAKSSGDMEPFNLKAGFIEQMHLDENGITAIAKMPGKAEMQSQFAGSLEGFIGEFAGLIESMIREFHGLVEARAEQLA